MLIWNECISILITLNLSIRNNLELAAFEDFIRCSNSVLEVDYDSTYITCIECVSVHTCAWSCCKLCLDGLVVHHYRIITWLCYLVLVREDVCRALICTVNSIYRLYSRIEKNVRKVCTTCTAEVGMRKTENGIVRIMIAGTCIPTTYPCIRAELNHTIRCCRTRISMGMEACTDHRIDVINRCKILRAASKCHDREER